MNVLFRPETIPATLQFQYAVLCNMGGIRDSRAVRIGGDRVCVAVCQKLKIDAIVGLRYWHLGESLEFTPSLIGGVSASQNWVDVLGGARIYIPVSQKAMITVGGDAGGGGANSDYQVAGILGYKIFKKCVLQAGWRYLDVNYQSSSSFVYNTATSGLLLGLTINLK